MTEKQIDPRMHSAEHLVNQALNRMTGCRRCFSTHLEKKKSKVDFHFERPLLADEIEQLQNNINEIIEADLPVTEEFVPRDEAERVFSLGRLPETAETVRIVRIGDYDACPCIGPHVSSTREIGRFRLISASFNSGVLRIIFKLDTR